MMKSCIWQVNSGHFIYFFYFIIQHLLWIKLWFFFILFFYRIITFHLISALLSNIRMISFYITSKYSFFKLIIVFF
jgi:hypothetical protein